MVKKLEGAGLRGQVAGETSLCTVGQEEGLAYRGHKIETLAEKGTFEEVAYLLLYGKLPNKSELSDYKSLLKGLRDLPDSLKKVLREIPASAHPMAVMATGCSMLGNLEPEESMEAQMDSINRMVATMPSIVTYWYKFSHDGEDIDLVNDEDTMAGHFLHILHGKTPSDLHRRVMDASLVLYAEHEFNASTFTARVCASTMSDIYSCVVAAIGSLKGPLHGGANEAVMEMMKKIKTPKNAESWIRRAMLNKELIMGFGHRVYKNGDSRVPTMKKCLEDLTQWSGEDKWLGIYNILADIFINEKGIYPNLDFPSGPAYYLMGFPINLYTPIFVMARVAGWSAHFIEQNANNSLIRPLSSYTGKSQRKVGKISERK